MTTPRSTASSPATTVSSSASPAEIAGRKALNVYLGMWHNMAAAARTSDWRSPLLGEYATGQALNTMSRGLYTDHRNGLVTRGEPVNAPSVAALDPAADPTNVTISDCGDSTNWLKYHAATGRRAVDGPGGRRAISAVVHLQDDQWMVSDFAVQAVGTC